MAVFKTTQQRPLPDLKELVWGSAGLFGTDTAFRELRGSVFYDVSFLRFKDEVEALGTALSTRLKPGARVVLLGQNGYSWVLAFMALVCGAGVPVPADAAISAADLKKLCVESGAETVLYDTAASQKVAALRGVTPIPFGAFPKLIRDGRAALREGDVSYRTKVIDRTAPAAVFYTSGTTGKRKGVVLSHAAMVAAVTAVGAMQPICPDDTFLSVLPLSHIYECVVGFLAPLCYGARVAFSAGLGRIVRDMRMIRPTVMVVIPYLAEELYRYFWRQVARRGNEAAVRRAIAVSDPVRPLAARQALKVKLLAVARTAFGGSLERMIVLGSYLDPIVQKGLRQIGVFTVQGYGVTECAGLAALGGVNTYCDGAAGHVLPEGVLDVYDPDADGSGELRYKGANLMLGYNHDEARTAAVLYDGWYYTGDVGRIDENGFVHIIGRLQNRIEKADGKWVCPEELETLLCQSPFIKEALTVGVLNAGGTDSEIAAMLYPDKEEAADVLGHAPTDEELEKLIGEWVGKLNEELPAHKQITLYALREEPFPRSTAGRIRRAGYAEEIARAVAKGE